MSDIIKDMHEYLESSGSVYKADVKGTDIWVFPGVFSPVSPYSCDAFSLASENDALPGEMVLDMGAGTGVHSVLSAKKGASVVAVDCCPKAVANCRYNVRYHGLEHLVETRQGDLFENVDGKFDLIIANLPFTDTGLVDSRLEDPGYVLHRRFFSEVRDYMGPGARLHMAFADIGDVDTFEYLAEERLEIEKRIERIKSGVRWYVYKLR